VTSHSAQTPPPPLYVNVCPSRLVRDDLCDNVTRVNYTRLDYATNKSLFSLLRTLTTRHCSHSPAAAAERRSAAIDRYLLPTGPKAAILLPRVCWRGPMLGQTDRQTDITYTLPYTMRAVPIRKSCYNTMCYIQPGAEPGLLPTESQVGIIRTYAHVAKC